MTESLKDFCDFVTAQLPGVVPTVLLPHPNYERFAPQEGSRLPDALSNGVVGSASSFASAHRTARSRTDEASVADLRRDPSFAACWGPALNDGAQAAWSVPILSKGREILGTLIFFYPTAQHPTERHVTVMQRAVEMAALVIEGRRLTDGADDTSRAPAEKRRRPCLGGLIGESRSMHQVYDLIQKVSEHDYPVLILGESGTGKELVAKSAHLSGLRSNKPFIPIDCSSLVPTLAETELFGYVRGAFTGAVRRKQGLMEIAGSGTLFLDEIGDMPLDMQAKLLRVLQEREVRPVGSTGWIPLAARVIAATNRDLETAVRRGTFRQDLFFRLNVVQIELPPLRERKSDIPVLVDAFLEKFNASKSDARTVSDDAMSQMMAYDWPGNVRELENAIERAVALGSGSILHASDLPACVKHRNGDLFLSSEEALQLEAVERRTILRALDQTNGDKPAAAALLGISKTTLYRKLKHFGADWQSN